MNTRSLAICSLTSVTLLWGSAMAQEQWDKHVVKKGESLNLVYRKMVRQGRYKKSFQVFLDAVEAKNPSLYDLDRIEIGDVIQIPVPPVKKVAKKQSPPSPPAKATESKPIAAKQPEVKTSPPQASERAPIVVIDKHQSKHYWLTSIRGSYSRIDTKEKANGTEANMLSSPNVGMEVMLDNRSQKGYSDRVKFFTAEEKFEEKDTKQFESSKVRVHGFRFERMFYWKSGWFAAPGIVLEQSNYLSAAKTDLLVIDPIHQPGLNLEIGYKLGSEDFWSSLASSSTYLSSAQASSFRINHGRAFEASVNVGWKWTKNTTSELELWQDYRFLDSSVATQKNRSLGLNLGFGLLL